MHGREEAGLLDRTGWGAIVGRKHLPTAFGSFEYSKFHVFSRVRKEVCEYRFDSFEGRCRVVMAKYFEVHELLQGSYAVRQRRTPPQLVEVLSIYK